MYFQSRYGCLALLGVLISGCTGQVGGSFIRGSDEEGEESNGGKGGQDSEPKGDGGGGADPGTPELASTSQFPRLTHFQYRNAARDLLRLPGLPAFVTSLQSDAVLGFDNDNDSKALDVSFDLRTDYERVAEALAAYVVNDALAVRRLVPANAPSDLEGKSRAVMMSLAERAYRRPLAKEESDELWLLMKPYLSASGGGEPFLRGLEVLISALLQSPWFLYRPELGGGTRDAGFALTPFELATRLSFALTDTAPDDELLEAARAGQLKSAEQLRSQGKRLLETEAAAASAEHFHEQLFRTASFNKIQKDVKLYPQFSTDLVTSLKEEARLFLRDIAANQGASAILTSSETFVDRKLAPLYGVTSPPGDAFKQTELNTKERQGILTQLGFLASNAGAVDPDPIHRGVFISQVLLCKQLPPPAANVAPVPAGAKTNRERVENHTGKGTCGQACHATLINPLGYAFENYDAAGVYRTKDNGQAVDSSGKYAELVEGEISFANGIELSGALAQSRDFHACYVGNWAGYLWSRTQQQDDAEALRSIIDASMEGALVRDLLLDMISLPSFARFVP